MSSTTTTTTAPIPPETKGDTHGSDTAAPQKPAAATVPAVIQIGSMTPDMHATVRFPWYKSDADKVQRTMTVFCAPEYLQAVIRASMDNGIIRPMGEDTYHSPAKPYLRIKVHTKLTEVTGARSNITDIQRGDKVVLACKPCKFEYNGNWYLSLRCFAIHVVGVYTPPIKPTDSAEPTTDPWGPVEGFKFH